MPVLDMKIALEALLPPGELWKPRPSRVNKSVSVSEFLDGDMEIGDTAAWSSGNAATLTKNLGIVHGGSRSLKIAMSQDEQLVNPYAYQDCLIIGNKYRVQGWAYGETNGGSNVATPSIRTDEGTVLWQGTTAESWQQFDVEFTAENTTLQLWSTTDSFGICFFDDMTLTLITEIIDEGDFDKLLFGMADNAQVMYDFMDSLASIRDPFKTPILSDLEKEYGIITDTTISESARRQQLSAVVYALRGTGSDTYLEERLFAAGFTAQVQQNSPEIDPAILIDESWLTEAGEALAQAGEPLALAGWEYNGDLIVNGPDDLSIYTIPTGPGRWRYIFFVAESFVGFDPIATLIDGNMEAGDTAAWTPQWNAALSKITTNPKSGNRAMRIEYNGTPLPYATQDILIASNTYKFTGWARGDGTYAPSVVVSAPITFLWTGIKSTEWQYFDVEFTPAVTKFGLMASAAGAGYCDFDEVKIYQRPIAATPLQVPNEQRTVIRKLILKHKPLHSWCGLIAEYT